MPAMPATADAHVVESLEGAVEAVLLVAEAPVAAIDLAQVLERPVVEVEGVLIGLAARYDAAGSGFALRRVAGGWRLATRPEHAPVVERFVHDTQPSRLSPAALEALAVVAYLQPVTRARVSSIRGVASDGVVRTLLLRGMLAEDGCDSASGAALLVTTPTFLEKLGLASLAELPAIAPMLPEVDEVAALLGEARPEAWTEHGPR
jgi:segregation and condensation protein B